MNFSNIYNKYITENKLKVKLIETSSVLETSNLISDELLLEAKKAKAELYKDLTISDKEGSVTADDVLNIKFYEKGKNIKQGKAGDELKKISNTQADLFNKILAKVKEDSKNRKTTLVELTAAAVKVFRDAGQNAPTAGYNLRGVLSILIGKNFITPAEGSINVSAVTVGPAEGERGTEDIESSGDTTDDTISPEQQPTSKFDSVVTDHKPTATGEYLKVDKGVAIEKSDFESRDARIAARYIIDTIREELPGFYNKQSLAAKAQEEDAGMSPEEVSSMVDKLVRMNKITLVPKAVEGEGVPDEQDETGSEEIETETEPSDIVDRMTTGSTRKGFNYDAFNNY